MNKRFLQYPLYLLLILFSLVACDGSLEDIEVDPPENEYLVNAELVNSFSLSEITVYINLAMLAYPDEKEQLEKLLTEVKTGVEIFKISYNTTFNESKVVASGLVCVPSQAGDYPILSYQNGTNTEHSKAPSEDANNQLFQILEMMGSTGFIVTIPDYLGFGESSSMFHPYLHKQSTVQTVTDMWRATKEALALNESINLNNDVYITGYSQGGWATMAIHEAAQKNNIGDFTLKASSCGGGPYNIPTLNEYITTQSNYKQPYFIGYIFNSYLNLGLSTDIGSVFQAPYDERIPTLYNGTNSGSDINSQLTTTVADLFTSDYLNNWNTGADFAPVREMLTANSIAAFETNVPILLSHGTDDDYVPPVVSTNIYQDFVDLGHTSITYLPLKGLDHGGAIVPSGLASISWFIQLKK